MVGRQTIRGQLQRIPQTPARGAATTQDFVMYTCPADKKAVIESGSVYLDTFGSDTESRLRYAGTTVISFIFGVDAVGTTKPAPPGVLTAGQTITKNGNNSGNSNQRYNLVIKELPA